MDIEVKVIATTEVAVDTTVTPVEGRRPDPPGAARLRFLFSDDLVLERFDDRVPGDGLPQASEDRLAGTHSGCGTTLRVADGNDGLYPEGSMLFQYEGTFLFDAVTAELPAELPKGQLVTRGVALFDRGFNPLRPLTFAIVGGTGSYEGASGQLTHSGPGGETRTLSFTLPPHSSETGTA